MLAQLEAAGELVATDDVTADASNFTFDASTTDVELRLDDEDEAPVEAWETSEDVNTSNVALGANADEPEAGNQDQHQFVIRDGACTPPSFEWAKHFNPATQRAKDQLYEISNRSRVVIALASWLNSHRANFLASCDFWDLGPASLEEAFRGCSVLQKDLLVMLDLNPAVREETLSRYLNNTELVWQDGSAPIQILFSKQARLAWVACAVVLFARKYPKVPLRRRLKSESVSSRKSSARGAKGSTAKTGAWTFQEFLQEINRRAGTSWPEVLDTHEARMIKEWEHGH
jgi:hypothetical protein